MTITTPSQQNKEIIEKFEERFVDRLFEPDGDWAWKKEATPYNIKPFLLSALEQKDAEKEKALAGHRAELVEKIKKMKF